MDAETQSERILDYKGMIVLTLTGFGFILFFGWGLVCTFGKEKKENVDKEEDKKVEA